MGTYWKMVNKLVRSEEDLTYTCLLHVTHIYYLPKNELAGNNLGYFSVGYQIKENYNNTINA